MNRFWPWKALINPPVYFSSALGEETSIHAFCLEHYLKGNENSQIEFIIVDDNRYATYTKM